MAYGFFFGIMEKSGLDLLTGLGRVHESTGPVSPRVHEPGQWTRGLDPWTPF